MPAPEIASLPQRAVLWTVNSFDDYGNMQLNEPIEIRCRWVGAIGKQLDPLTNTQIDMATTVIVDRTIPLDSIIWLGKLADLPDTPTDLNQVKAYNDTPDIKGRITHRQVGLVKFSSTLPLVISS